MVAGNLKRQNAMRIVGIILAVVVASSVLGYFVGANNERTMELEYRAEVDALRIQVSQVLNLTRELRRDVGSVSDRETQLESQVSKMSQTVDSLRTVYSEPASIKPQAGQAWSKVSDPFSLSGTVMKASSLSQNGSILFGPYLSKEYVGMLGKRYTAVFRCKVGSNSPPDYVVYVDVTYDMVHVLNSLKIKASDFTLSNAWQDFQLSFAAPSNMTLGLEFRVQNLNEGVTDIYIDQIQLRK